MKEHLRVMSDESVQRTLAGVKTETRRVFTPQPPAQYSFPQLRNGVCLWSKEKAGDFPMWTHHHSGLPAKGDHLLVRESWGVGDSGGYLVDPCLNYRADGEQRPIDPKFLGAELAAGRYKHREGWRSPRFMYKWAIRIRLEVLDVWAHRLREIPTRSIAAEGLRKRLPSSLTAMRTMMQEWMTGWDALNAKRGYPYESNPWVYAVRYKLVNVEGGMICEQTTGREEKETRKTVRRV